MTDRIDAAVYSVQTTTRGSTMDSGLGQSSADELAECHDAVLPGGNTGHS